VESKEYNSKCKRNKEQEFISWFSSSQRLAYLHIVEEAKIALESLSTHSSSLTHHQGDGLRFSLKCWTIIDLHVAHHKHGSSQGNV
jgi:hypothetical protein